MLPKRYNFVTDLNKGSYGVVSLARDAENDNKLVAIKSVTSSIEEAKQEIAIHHKLSLSNHPNICGLIDWFEQDGQMFLVLEYCKQGDLFEAIKGDRLKCNFGELMEQLIDAVEFCHSQGIYHRDIKPENVLFDDCGQVKLADFGLATTSRWCVDFGVGSERYMAPELFDEDNTVEYDAAKVDIWSIGICLVNVLFSRNPFTMASADDKLFMDFAANREALFDIFPTLSNDAFAMLRYSLTLDPDNRSLSNMRDALMQVKSWTIDDYYDEDDDDEEDYEDEDEFYQDELYYDNGPDYDQAIVDDDDEDTVVCNAAITTTTNRKPLRTPSIDVGGESSYFETHGKPWIRTMQFTPPTQSTLHASMMMKKSARKNSSLRHFSMESVDESDENTNDNDNTMNEEDEDEEKVAELSANQSDEDIFVMDLNNSLSKMSVRNSSDTGSIDSVPSLVPSTASSQMSSSMPAWSIPTAKTPPNRDFLKFGTSWSDLVFEDDVDLDHNDEEFFDLIKSGLNGAQDIPDKADQGFNHRQRMGQVMN